MLDGVDLYLQESGRSQVLRNEDLLGLIMELMDRSNTFLMYEIKKPDSTHLLWASLTCKAFFCPAINVLWRSMSSLEAIMGLIPTLKKDQNNCYVSRATGLLISFSDISLPG